MNTQNKHDSRIVSIGRYIEACAGLGVQPERYVKLPATHPLPTHALFKSVRVERAGQSQVEPFRDGKHTHLAGGAPLVKLTFETRRVKRPAPQAQAAQP